MMRVLKWLLAGVLLLATGDAALAAEDEPREVQVFMKEWKAAWDAKGLAGFTALSRDTNAVSLILSALEREPGGVWCWALEMLYLTRLPLDQPDGPDAWISWKKAHGILERAAGTSPTPALDHNLRMAQEKLALASVESDKDLESARKLADQLLRRAARDTNSWDHGNLVFTGHTILGRVALRDGNLQLAREELIRSSQTPGSPQLNSFGPRMDLARELLQRGGKENQEAVLHYLDGIVKFWAKEAGDGEEEQEDASAKLRELETWKSQVRKGVVPESPKWKR